MFNFPFYSCSNKKKLVLNKNLNDYIRKSNNDCFNKIIERNKIMDTSLLIKYNIKNILADRTNINHIYKLDINDHYLSSLANLNNLTYNVIILIPKLISGTTIFIGITYLIIKLF